MHTSKPQAAYRSSLRPDDSDDMNHICRKVADNKIHTRTCERGGVLKALQQAHTRSALPSKVFFGNI